MNVQERAVVLAIALFDGYIQHRTGKAVNAQGYEYQRNSYTLTVVHGPNQRAYCEWKAARLTRALGGQQVNVREQGNGPGGRHTAYAFSKSGQIFKRLHRDIYRGGHRKIISRKLLDRLTPEAIAIWYLDEGHARRNHNKDGWVSSVCTDITTCCSHEEAIGIRDWFLERYGIEWRIRCDKRRPEDRQFSIQCNTQASREFARLVAPYIHHSMLYKLSHVGDLISHERQAPRAAR